MRILHVNKFLYRRGGAEAYLFDLAALQERAGHEVSYFGMAHPENPPLPYARYFPSFVELEPPPPGLTARARAAGRMIYSTASRDGMRQTLREFRPDVVHLHNIYHQLSPSVLGPVRVARVPAVMTLHDYKLACPSYLMLDHGRVCDSCVTGSLFNPLRHRCKDGSLAASAMLAAESAIHRAAGAYRPVQSFICPSRFCAGVMARAGVFPDRLRVLGNFIDSAAIAPKDRPGGGVVYVGRLSHEKGLDTLVEALGLLTSATLDVVGTGPQLEALRAQGQRVAPGRVRFHGQVPKPIVLDLLRSNAVAVLPSRCNENQPMAVLEAFACGVPVVATALGGVPELVAAGRFGDTLSPDCPAALADALRRLLDAPDTAFRMGQDARAYVAREHAPETHLRAIERIYAAASSRHKAA
ncbi:MAG: glycosyltransferase family 4 protein [Nocardioides sp.]|nr:glycosyltransferase family 4 protein [Nocardioides sp.]